jgi:hypothetical protein
MPNRQPIFIETPEVVCQIVSIAPDSNLSNPTSISAIYGSTGSAGTLVKRITITALDATSAGLVRLWMYDYSQYYLWKEIPVTAETPDDTTPAWTYTFNPSDLQIGNTSGGGLSSQIFMSYTGTTVDFSVVVEVGRY